MRDPKEVLFLAVDIPGPPMKEEKKLRCHI